MPRTEDTSTLDTASDDQFHYVNLAGGYHHAPASLSLPFSTNVPLTGGDITIKQEYHVSPSRINGESHSGTGVAYPMGESPTHSHYHLPTCMLAFLLCFLVGSFMRLKILTAADATDR